MVKHEIQADDAPKAVGPYSQGIRWGDLLFLAGQIPIDPATGDMITGDAAAQAERVLQNVGALLAAAGTGFDRVLKATMFLVDLNDFAAVNAVYSRYFVAPFPARSTIQVAALPKGARVEIEVVAAVGD